MINLDQEINSIFSNLSEKERKVISERTGLEGERRTLQAIGNDLDLTRERIRQIEGEVINKITPKLEEAFSDLFKKVEGFLDQLGGVRRADFFVRDVAHLGEMEETDHKNNKIRFIFEMAGPVNYQKETDDFLAFWYASEEARKRLFDFIDEAVDYFKSQGQEAILGDHVYMEEFSDLQVYNFLPISKKFGVSAFGDFGLREWPEIEPKVVRDKAYLVLKKEEEPLHFRDIAKKISEHGVDEEEMHVQTVHNELIKDNRFVLVGRGMYGLQEHGYEGGTAKEVIHRVLQEHGPLTSDEVVELVNERKILQDNTILLNLQNTDHFERKDDGKYHIKQA